jgi:hypothetical protein
LTLDEDVAMKLKERSRRSGRSFREVVNEALRVGLNARRKQQPDRPFRVRARALGLRPGLSYDNVSELLEQIEAPGHK